MILNLVLFNVPSQLFWTVAISYGTPLPNLSLNRRVKSNPLPHPSLFYDQVQDHKLGIKCNMVVEVKVFLIHLPNQIQVLHGKA